MLLSADRGYATVVTAGIIAAITSVMIVMASAGALVVASHQSRNAADNAAVAGAFALFRAEDGCAAAATVAQLNGATLVHCRVIAPDIQITVQVRTRKATARAGPL